MDKSGKVYVKAMNKYNDGYIDKAVRLCEKSISLNNTNAAALNLKGILFYIKGDLEKAKQTWNINYKRNNDKVSKKYLNDSVRDKEKLQLYVNALELIKQLNISGALKLLEQCKSSDFNFINVNNYISVCYIKQGEYDKAYTYIKQVTQVDKKNIQAIINKNILIEYGNIKREINYKKIFIAAACIVLTVIVIFPGRKYMYKMIDNNKTKSLVKIESEKLVEVKAKVEVEKQKLNSNDKKSIEINSQEATKFPYEQLDESLKKSNMELIVGYVNAWKNTKLDINDKLLIVKGEEVIKSNGVPFFYEKGMAYIKDKKFIEAQKYFLYALPYSNDNYLQEHIVYMLALAYKATSDFENAIKYYELSLKQSPRGSYSEEVLYNLITINNEVDVKKSKSYAKKLVNQFPNSQYNNSIVKEILKKD